MATKVNDKSEAIKRHEAAWTMITALMGGTEAMRAAKTKFLPKFPQEEQDDYDNRLHQSTLYPAYKRTLSVMVGKPFSEPLVLSEDMPEELEEICKDIDLEGNSLHTWSAHVFHCTLGWGLGGILVDYPVVNGGSGARTRAEERQLGARPYFVHIKHDQLLGWKVKRGSNGKPEIAQLRLMESVEEDDGEWGTACIPQVRVLEPGRWRTYREKEVQGKGKEWVLHEEGVMTFPRVPFVFLYGMRKAFGDADPPLLDLAFLNVKHWQSQSDQDNITHVARVPILFVKGHGGEGAAPIKIGQQAVTTENTEADMKFVEHTGKAIEAGEKSLEKLEGQMIQTGAELLVMKPGQRTATEDNNEKEGSRSDLQRIVEGFEDSVDQALAIAAEWQHITLKSSNGLVKLFSDFGAWSLDQASGNLIKDLAMAGLLDKVTAIEELQRRGIISPDRDAQDILDLVEEEGPPLGSLSKPPADPAINP